MAEKLKQIDKKYLIIAGIVFGLIILIIILMVVLKMLSGPGKDYTKLEKKMVEASRNYFKGNPDEIPGEGTSIVLDSETLISSGNLKELTKYVDDESCTASVTVMNNGGKSLYLPDVKCSEYHTVHLAEKVVKDQLLEESENPYEGGLYKVGDEYIFKGKTVNNYITFGGLNWRILKIDENGNLRLIRDSAEKTKRTWDTKYNVDVNRNYGINDYENSYLLEMLEDSYNTIKNEENKAHLIPHNVCIGKRSEKNMAISYDVDCSKILENQYISTINTLDFPMASLDENCKEVGLGACTNYNYLFSVISSSWTTTGSADDTYQVYSVSGGYTTLSRARTSYNYYWVVYVSGEELYQSGSGTAEDPYVIG